jgi:hypothetical protein
MENEDETEKQRHRIELACQDFALAKEIALHLLKKGWHEHHVKRRGASRMQQTAFTTAFVVTYWRPFSGTRGGWKPLDTTGMDLTDNERDLHEQLHGLRDQVHAHTDRGRHDRRLWVAPQSGREFILRSEPPYHLSKMQLESAVVILDKLKLHFCLPPVIKRPSPGKAT